jgi:hypothetical protein
MLARRKSNRHLKNYQLISGGRISIEHLLLTSSSVILFGFGSGLDVINASTAASRGRWLLCLTTTIFQVTPQTQH